ncbi:hypothetical protein FGO68_gene14087 [Halteria grandinella]|uniref:Uncharacterized protein n=1 Tax=Halteria grandinella TaxID=5974 RepID=A0A8J8P1B0_HALGN|nr:hypothetical protein FGO68_gene14087 [Halteria grandinella]
MQNSDFIPSPRQVLLSYFQMKQDNCEEKGYNQSIRKVQQKGSFQFTQPCCQAYPIQESPFEVAGIARQIRQSCQLAGANGQTEGNKNHIAYNDEHLNYAKGKIGAHQNDHLISNQIIAFNEGTQQLALVEIENDEKILVNEVISIEFACMFTLENHHYRLKKQSE